jgi:hypothetical protein
MSKWIKVLSTIASVLVSTVTILKFVNSGNDDNDDLINS